MDGLSFLHERDIIHADLKGVRVFIIYCCKLRLTLLKDNVLMSIHGTPMLTDFGQSRASVYAQMRLEAAVLDDKKSTTRWMAYELLDFLEDEDADIVCTKASDIWALGMVIYVSHRYFREARLRLLIHR